jgi:hypothetical protein
VAVTLVEFSDEKYMFASIKKMFRTIIFPACEVIKGVLNKGPTRWLDGARSAKICIPPSFLGTVQLQPVGVPTNIVCFRVYENECL